MKLRHFKYLKPSFPWRIKKFKGDFNYTQRFTFEDPVYDLKDKVEQDDWNKLTGIKPKYFRPHVHSKMVAWRWDLATELVEVAWYWHDEDTKFHFSDVLFTLKKGESLDVGMWRDQIITEGVIQFALQKVGSKDVYSEELNESGRVWLLESWFGGDLPPTRTLTLIVNVIKKLMFNVR